MAPARPLACRTVSRVFAPVEVGRDRAAVVAFLCASRWPFHGQAELSEHAARAIEVDGDSVASFWVRDGTDTVGLIRLLDLDDIGEGAPQFDLRISGSHRGRGHGTAATRWLVDHLFSTHAECHRIEANTRDDNVAMQRALTAAGFVLEGRLRQSWRDETIGWLDTVVYGILRDDWQAPSHPAAP